MSGDDLVENIFTAWRAGRIEEIVGLFAPDAIWHFSAATKPPAIGHAAIRDFLVRYSGMSRENRLRLLRQVRQGDTLFFEAVEDFTTVQDRIVQVPYAGCLTLRDGLITDWRDYFDRGLIDGQIQGTATLPDYALPLLDKPVPCPVPPAKGGRVGDIILTALARFPDRIAFIDGESQVSYADLGRRIAQALDAFVRLGLRPGDTVAQLSANGTDMYAVMAAAYIGGYRSLTLHPLAGREDQQFILADAGARVLIADAKHVVRATELSVAGLRCLGHAAADGLEPFWNAADTQTILPDQAWGGAETIVRLAYTGGTTGRPKGVMLSNRALVANSMMALAGIPWPADDIRFLCPAPISHGAGSIILPTLVRGGTIILQQGFEVARFCAALTRYRANVTWLVPTMLIGLLDQAEAAHTDFTSLRTLIWSGAPMAPGRVCQAIDRFGPVLVQCYGQTEAPNTILTLAGTDLARKPMAAGRPFPGLEVALLDGHGQPVTKGAAGEICVRGPLVMSGYWRMPEASREAFAHGWLHTGDIGRIDADGDWHIIDRQKEMIITGGFNVFPKEVEDVLTAQPGVAAACVFGAPHPKWGEAVAAVVVTAPGATLSAEALAQAVRDAKGPIQVPKLIEPIPAIPLTGLGKPDRKALRQMFQARMPE